MFIKKLHCDIWSETHQFINIENILKVLGGIFFHISSEKFEDKIKRNSKIDRNKI